MILNHARNSRDIPESLAKFFGKKHVIKIFTLNATILAKTNGKKYKNPSPQNQCCLYGYFCCFSITVFAVNKILFSYLDILGLSQKKVFFLT